MIAAHDAPLLPGMRTISVHASLNLFEGSTGCHEWSAGIYLVKAVRVEHIRLTLG